jgi:hypothetical protein
MRNTARSRIYVTAMGLWLMLLVVSLWSSGWRVDEVHAEAESGFSTTADDVPFLAFPAGCIFLPETAWLAGFLPSRPVSSAAFILWPKYLHARHPVSRGPPSLLCPPYVLNLARRLMGILASRVTGGREDIPRGKTRPCEISLSTRIISSARRVMRSMCAAPSVEAYLSV